MFAGLALTQVNMTYSTSLTMDVKTGNVFVITATDGVAFTINAPSNATVGQRISIRIKNTSGGALGTVTWNAIFKMTAWTSPATGFSRFIEFTYTNVGANNWIETSRSAADVPN
jgi:hypothetical protein